MDPRSTRTISMRDLNPNDAIILLLGPSGSGKSTFINTAIRDDKLPVGHTLHSETKEPQAVRYRDGNQDVVFIDTPCYNYLAPQYGPATVPLLKTLMNTPITAIFYVHSIVANRLGLAVTANLGVYEVFYHQGTVGHFGCITTMWTLLEDANVGQLREKSLMKTLLRSGPRLHNNFRRFEGTAESAWDIIHDAVAGVNARQREKELARIDELINSTMMHIRRIKIPISRRLKDLLLLKAQKKTSIKAELAFMLEQVRSSRSTLQISNSLITDAASMTGSTITISTRDAASLSSDETFHSVVTYSDYSEVSSFSIDISCCDTPSFVTSRTSPYSISMQASTRSTDEITMTSRSSSQVERLASLLSHSINHLTQIIAEARRINPAQVNMDEGDNYFGPVYNSGGFVGGRNNYNNLNNAANGLVEDCVTRITVKRTTQSQL